MMNPAFTPKHQKYIDAALRATISVAEGAVRAGKTIDNIAAFAWMINNATPDRIHLATGSTVANAKLNIGDANGYGLEFIFRGRCRWTKYKGNEALVIKSHGRDYIVVFAGAAKSDSFKKIRGNSYGMWIATEINLHHKNTVREAFNRQLAARNRRVFWDMNPSSPGEWIYTDYIDRFTEQFGDKYNYQHFTIHDNASITPERIAEIESQYVKGSIWYRRDILGERCNAEGLVYPMFDNVVPTVPREYDKYVISMDYGILNPTAMTLYGRFDGVWYAVKEYYHSGRETQNQKTDEQYYADLRQLAGDLPIYRVIIDPSAASFITLVAQKRGFKVWDADNAVLEGIQHTAQCLSDKTILINDCCKRMIMEFGLYRWDEESPEDKVVKEHDHAMDNLRYFVQTMGIWQKKK